MKMFILVFGFALFSVLAAAEGASDEFGILFSESRPFHFTGAAEPDILTVQYLGESCLSTVVLYTVRKANDNFPIFAKAQPIFLGDPASLPEFRGFYEQCEQTEIHKLGKSEEFWLTHEKNLVDEEMSFIGEEYMIDYHADAETRRKAKGAQLLCLDGGYESATCYWYDREQERFAPFLTYGL